MALPFQLGADDLVDVEEAVLLETDLDERRLHAGEDVVDDALVDVAGDRAPPGALEVHLGHAVVLEHGDRLLGDVHGDEELALRRRQRRPAGRLLAPRVRSGARALAGRGLRLWLLRQPRLGILLGSLGLRRLRLALPVTSTARSASPSRSSLGGVASGRSRGYWGCFRLVVVRVLRVSRLRASALPERAVETNVGPRISPSNGTRARPAAGEGRGTCGALCVRVTMKTSAARVPVGSRGLELRPARPDRAEPHREPRPGPRLDLRVPRLVTREVANAVEILEPRVRLFDLEQLLCFRSRRRCLLELRHDTGC